MCSRKPGEHGLRAARAGEYFKKRAVIQCQKVFKGQIRDIKLLDLDGDNW